MTYEVRFYKPSREEAFSETGMTPDLADSFNNGYEEGYQEYTEGLEEVSGRPEPKEGDIATIINLNGQIDLVACGLPASAISTRAGRGYQAVMPVAAYIDTYFSSEYGQQYLEVINNVGSTQPQLSPPVRVGAKVTLATWNAGLDAEGNEILLPDDIVVITAAPPPEYIEVNELGEAVASNYAPQEMNPWYVFVRKDNLDIYALEDLQDGDYRITNFEGEYPRVMKKEDGTFTRNVQEFITDMINNGYTPPGFGIGSIGFVRYDGDMAGTLQFYNPEHKSRRMNDSWYVWLLPSNVIPLIGAKSPSDVEREGEIDYKERKERERAGRLEKRRTKVSATERNVVWADNKTGEIKSAGVSPGITWVRCPKIILNGQEISSDLESVEKYMETVSDIEVIKSNKGSSSQPTSLKIGGFGRTALIEQIMATAAPLRVKSFDNFDIIRYR
jgi:hypothetical protein